MATTTINYDIRPSLDGKFVILSVQRNAEKANTITIEAEAVANVVIGLLGAVIGCAEKTGQADAPIPPERDLEQVPFVVARGVGLYDQMGKPNLIGMSLIFGQTEVGIGLPRDAAGPLAQALLASTANTSRRNDG